MLDERLAASLKGRLAIHQARYRHSKEELGRIWIQLDGREIAAFSTAPALRRRREIADELMDANDLWGSSTAYHEADRTALELMTKRGEQSDYTAWHDLEAYLSLSIDAALLSPNPLIRGLAFADRRLGKRRLMSQSPGVGEHALIREIYAARCAAEGIDLDRDV